MPGKYPVAFDGRPFALDTLHEAYLKQRFIPLMRNQADGSNVPGRSSLNPDAYWTREQESWHYGAGQTYLDRVESNPARFNSSKGIDPSEKWRMKLLPKTDQKRVSVNASVLLEVAGTYLYMFDGALMHRTQDVLTAGVSTWTNVPLTGAPAAAYSLTSDGYTLFSAHGAAGIYSTTRGAATSTQYNPRAATLVQWAIDRLIAANGRIIVNITGPATETIILNHPNTDWLWTAVSEGETHIYMAGYSGDKSRIFKTTIRPDGTALDIATPAAPSLPDGEIIYELKSYAGVLFVGTSLGVRVAEMDANGNLVIGGLVQVDVPVRCFEPQGNHVWFGWTNFDAYSTGLGRLSPRDFTQVLVPAYWSDLMAGDQSAAVQGNVLSVVTFQDRRVFSVGGKGVYAEDDDLVELGWLKSGLFNWGLASSKVADFVDVRHRVLSGTHRVYLSPDEGAFVLVGEHDTDHADHTPFLTPPYAAESFELMEELLRATTTTLGPEVTRHVFGATAAPSRFKYIFVPIILHENVLERDGEGYFDPLEIVEWFEAKLLSQIPIIYQVGIRSYRAKVDDLSWDPVSQEDNGRGPTGKWDGTLLVKLKVEVTA